MQFIEIELVFLNNWFSNQNFVTKVCFWFVNDVYNGYNNLWKWVSTNYYVSIISLKIEKENLYLCDSFYIEWCYFFKKRASVSDKTFRKEHVFQIFKLSFSEFKLAFLLNFIGFHRFSSLNKVFVLGFLFIQCVPVGLVLFSCFVIGLLGWLVR